MRSYANQVVRGANLNASNSKIPPAGRQIRNKKPPGSNIQITANVVRGKSSGSVKSVNRSFVQASAECAGCSDRCDEIEESIINLRDECSLALQILQQRIETKFAELSTTPKNSEARQGEEALDERPAGAEDIEDGDDPDDTVIHMTPAEKRSKSQPSQSASWKPAVEDLEMRIDLVLTKFQDKLGNLQLHQDTIQTRQNVIQENHQELQNECSTIKQTVDEQKSRIESKFNRDNIENEHPNGQQPNAALLPPRLPRGSPTISVARSCISQAASECQEEILSKLTNCVRNLSKEIDVLRQNGDQRTNYLSGEFGVLSSRVTKLNAQLNVLQPAFEVYRRLQPPEIKQNLSWPNPGEATPAEGAKAEPGTLNATADQPLPTSKDAQDAKIEALQGEVSQLKELVAAQNTQIALLMEKKETETDRNVSAIEQIEESDFPTTLRSMRIDEFEVEDLVRELRDGVTNVAEQQVATVQSVRFQLY